MKNVDIFIDEDKMHRCFGALVTTSQPALDQILHNIRHRYGFRQEVKWKELSRFSLPVAVSWTRTLIWFRWAEMYMLPWPKGSSKGDILVTFLRDLARERDVERIGLRHDVAVFLDFDSVHKIDNLQQYIQREANLLRCYHFDSRSTDLLQLCDLLLGGWNRKPRIAPHELEALETQWCRVDDLLHEKRLLPPVSFSDKVCKEFYAAYLHRRLQWTNRKVITDIEEIKK